MTIRVRAKQLLFYAGSLVMEDDEFTLTGVDDFDKAVMDKVSEVPTAPVKKVLPPAQTFPAITSLPPAAALVGSEIGVGGAQTARTAAIAPGAAMPDLPVAPPEATASTENVGDAGATTANLGSTEAATQPATVATSSPRRRSTAAMRG